MPQGEGRLSEVSVGGLILMGVLGVWCSVDLEPVAAEELAEGFLRLGRDRLEKPELELDQVGLGELGERSCQNADVAPELGFISAGEQR